MNERRVHARVHDERGLVGKALVLTLLILAVLGVAALDAVSVLTARYRTADAADRAAEETAYAYKQSRDLRGACQRPWRRWRRPTPRRGFRGAAASSTPGRET